MVLNIESNGGSGEMRVDNFHTPDLLTFTYKHYTKVCIKIKDNFRFPLSIESKSTLETDCILLVSVAVVNWEECNQNLPLGGLQISLILKLPLIC